VGNVNLRFFTVNYTMSSSFSLSKTVNLMVFYSKIISQLFTVYSTETFCLPINSFALSFIAKITIIVK